MNTVALIIRVLLVIRANLCDVCGSLVNVLWSRGECLYHLNNSTLNTSLTVLHPSHVPGSLGGYDRPAEHRGPISAINTVRHVAGALAECPRVRRASPAAAADDPMPAGYGGPPEISPLCLRYRVWPAHALHSLPRRTAFVTAAPAEAPGGPPCRGWRASVLYRHAPRIWTRGGGGHDARTLFFGRGPNSQNTKSVILEPTPD